MSKLNDDRQGEGGTLAVIKTNITTIPNSVQVFFLRVSLKYLGFQNGFYRCAPSRNRTYI